MLHKALVAAFASATIVAAFLALPADAANKEKRRSGSDAQSLDGRVTGQPRTCGYETFNYSSSGTTTGPYCH